MNKLLIYLVGMVVGSIIMLILSEVRQDAPIAEVYADYRHITIYEDGSFIGQTIDGVTIEGCVLTALCAENMKENYWHNIYEYATIDI